MYKNIAKQEKLLAYISAQRKKSTVDEPADSAKRALMAGQLANKLAELEQLRAIVTELTPSKFVILDDAFQGDNELKTNLVQTCKSYDVELWTV